MKQNRGRLKDVMKQVHVSERENEAQNSSQIRSDSSVFLRSCCFCS